MRMAWCGRCPSILGTLLTVALVAGGCDDDVGVKFDAAIPDIKVCAAGKSLCGSVCVDLLASAAHCGACDKVCKFSEVCSAGKCSLKCPPT